MEIHSTKPLLGLATAAVLCLAAALPLRAGAQVPSSPPAAPSTQPGPQQSDRINVLVLGNVKSSGKFQMRRGSRLSDALAAAGGIARIADVFPEARISRGTTVVVASLEKLLREGDATQNVSLDDNSIVYVMGATMIRVQVLGAVLRPGNIDVNEGDRLLTALARAGAEASAKSDMSRVFLIRVDRAGGKTASYMIDVHQALEKGDQRYDPILRDGDKIYVPEIGPFPPLKMPRPAEASAPISR